jgi:hypothetical protein
MPDQPRAESQGVPVGLVPVGARYRQCTYVCWVARSMAFRNLARRLVRPAL